MGRRFSEEEVRRLTVLRRKARAVIDRKYESSYRVELYKNKINDCDDVRKLREYIEDERSEEIALKVLSSLGEKLAGIYGDDADITVMAKVAALPEDKNPDEMTDKEIAYDEGTIEAYLSNLSGEEVDALLAQYLIQQEEEVRKEEEFLEAVESTVYIDDEDLDFGDGTEDEVEDEDMEDELDLGDDEDSYDEEEDEEDELDLGDEDYDEDEDDFEADFGDEEEEDSYEDSDVADCGFAYEGMDESIGENGSELPNNFVDKENVAGNGASTENSMVYQLNRIDGNAGDELIKNSADGRKLQKNAFEQLKIKEDAVQQNRMSSQGAILGDGGRGSRGGGGTDRDNFQGIMREFEEINGRGSGVSLGNILGGFEDEDSSDEDEFDFGDEDEEDELDLGEEDFEYDEDSDEDDEDFDEEDVDSDDFDLGDEEEEEEDDFDLGDEDEDYDEEDESSEDEDEGDFDLSDEDEEEGGEEEDFDLGDEDEDSDEEDFDLGDAEEDEDEDSIFDLDEEEESSGDEDLDLGDNDEADEDELFNFDDADEDDAVIFEDEDSDNSLFDLGDDDSSDEEDEDSESSSSNSVNDLYGGLSLGNLTSGSISNKEKIVAPVKKEKSKSGVSQYAEERLSKGEGLFNDSGANGVIDIMDGALKGVTNFGKSLFGKIKKGKK